MILGDSNPSPQTSARNQHRPGGFEYERQYDGFFAPVCILRLHASRAPSTHADVAGSNSGLRDNQPVITTALKKIGTDGADLNQLPYAADLSLADLPAGNYVLQVTAVDRVSKTSASQQSRFSIQ